MAYDVVCSPTNFVMDSNGLLIVCLILTFMTDVWAPHDVEAGPDIMQMDDKDENNALRMETKKWNNTVRPKRSARRDTKYRWPQKQVPYFFASDFNDTGGYLKSAMSDIEEYSCIKFRPGTYLDFNRVYIRNEGCTSDIGMIGGTQYLRMGPICRTKSSALQSLMLLLGMYPEQNRPDRDQYVNVFPRNAIPEKRYNFNRYSSLWINTYGIPYDYRSVAQWPRYAFSSNGKPTMEPKDPAYLPIFGLGKSLSFRNIKLMNLMYNCDDVCKSKPVCLGEGFVGKDCRCWCPGNPVIPCDDDPDSTAYCTGDVINELRLSGSIHSPGFLIGNNYPHLSLCRWRIETPYPSGTIRLELKTFYTERGYDNLIVYDGPDTSFQILVTLSGSPSLKLYSSTGSKILLVFISDISISGGGFSLDYYTIAAPNPVCQEGTVTLYDFTGIIYSPGFQTATNYPNNALCQWRITAPHDSANKVRIELSIFETEFCCDYLAVHDGPNTDYPRLAYLSGNLSRLVYTSTDSQLFLKFTTDGSISGRGFSLSYAVLEGGPIECTFESRCGRLELSQQNRYHWNAAGSTSTADTGPAGDHTYGDGRGKFLYAEASFGYANDKAVGKLTPPITAANPHYCIRFWYHMFGADIGGLWVIKSNLNINHNTTILWRKGTQGRHWIKEEEDLDIQIGRGFTIIFIAWKGQGERGDIAIDDLSLKPGRCQAGD